MYKDHSAEVNARLEDALHEALTVMGGIAVSRTKEVMQHGYGAPVMDTGALMRDVSWEVDAREMCIGNTLPYAAPVHDGTLHTPGRPYLADGMAAAAQDMADVCGEVLSRQMNG